jgi:hypothetical protein
MLNAPGSWHDSRVARPIYEKLRTQTPEGFYLVADTAFPRSTAQIEGKICVPIKTGQIIRGTTADIEKKLAFDRQLLSYRQTAEWGMRSLQGAFGRLRLPLNVDDAEETCSKSVSDSTITGRNELGIIRSGQSTSHCGDRLRRTSRCGIVSRRCCLEISGAKTVLRDSIIFLLTITSRL